MKVLKFLGLTLLTILVIYVIIAAVSAKEVKVVRTATVSQAPADVFAAVNDFNQYGEWNAWFQIDSNAEYTITGKGTEIGDVWSWESNHPEVGTGSMKHVEATPGKSAKNEMNFEGQEDPMMDVWVFEETEDGGTKISWSAEGEAPFFVRPFLGTALDYMIGPKFEKSLKNLEAHLEKNEWKGFEVTTEGPFEYIYISENIPVSEMQETFETDIEALFGHLAKNNVEPMGPPMGIFHSWGDSTKLDIAVPVAGKVKLTKNIMKGEMPAGKAAVYNYVGPYEGSEAAHYKMDDYLEKMNHEFAGPVVEIYYDDPEKVDAKDLRTKIVYFVK